MKAFTSIVVAAALIAPAIAHAGAGSRINTPGTDARHEANLTEAKTETGRESQTRAVAQPSASASSASASDARADNEPKKRQYRSALAGKRNVAKRVRD